MKDKVFNQYLYYILIGIISVLAILVFPMLGSELGLALDIPDTIAGWIILVFSSLATATVNIMIFAGFMNQAKLNVKDNPNYIEANRIMMDIYLKHGIKEKLPRSPHQWNTSQYSKKGITLFLGSILSCVAFSNAILKFDLVTFISYTITILFAVFFGLFQMKCAERYWTDEYYRYAKYMEEKYDTNRRKDLPQSRGTGSSESEGLGNPEAGAKQ